MNSFFPGRTMTGHIRFFTNSSKVGTNRVPGADICCPTFSDDSCCERKQRRAASYTRSNKSFFRSKSFRPLGGGLF